MSITVTAEAKRQIEKFLKQRGQGVGLRLGVKTSGCSGMAYVLEFVDVPEADDEIFEIDELQIIVAPKSLVYINGTELDFVKEGLNSGFKFNNPNSKNKCGCGQTFAV